MRMPITGTIIADPAAVLRPVRYDAPDIVTIEQRRIPIPVAKGPPINLHLVGDRIQAVFVLSVQAQHALRCLIVAAPQRVPVGRFIRLPCLEGAVRHVPRALRTRLQIAIITAHCTERWQPHRDALALAMLDTVL